MVGIYIKALMKGASKVSPTIKSVKPSVPKTKLEKAKSKLAIAKQKTKASAAKLKQTLFNLKEDRKKLNLREKKMGGGMMGRRFGYSEGKLAVTPREKQLAAQYGDKKRITRGDVITAEKKKSGKRMQAKGGTDPKISKDTIKKFIRTAKEDSMKDRMKQPVQRKRGILEPLKPVPPKKTLGKPLKEKP